jgi:hypothetical protein
MIVDTDQLIDPNAERFVLTINRADSGYVSGSISHNADFDTLCNGVTGKSGYDEIVEVVVVKRAVVRRTAFAAEASVEKPEKPEPEPVDEPF